MKRKSIPRIITNRQLNFTLSPVDTYNKKKMPYRLQNYEIDGTWNHHQSIILDCILDRLFKAMYKQYKRQPGSWRTKISIECVGSHLGGLINHENISLLDAPLYDAFIKHYGKDVFGEIKKEYRKSRLENPETAYKTFKDHLGYWNRYKFEEYRKFKSKLNNMASTFREDYEIGCNLIDMFEHYSFLRQYRYTLKKHLEKIASTRFRMRYKVKLIGRKPAFDDEGNRIDKGQLVDLYYMMKDFQNIFSVRFDGNFAIFNFNTPLGKIIIHNMLILDTDWLPISAMKLKKNAFFLYKRFVMNKRSGKYKSRAIKLTFEDIVSFLDMKWSNNSAVHKLIMAAIKDMLSNGLVDDFQWRRYSPTNRVYELKFNDEKDQEDHVDGNSVLKMTL
jgi:hypothetical protein